MSERRAPRIRDIESVARVGLPRVDIEAARRRRIPRIDVDRARRIRIEPARKNG